MKKYEEMSFNEQREVAELFANWLGRYTHEVIIKVMEKREEILNNDFTMNLLRELKDRTEKEQSKMAESMHFLLDDFDNFKEYDPHNNALTHADSYRNVLYDMYIK